MAVCARPCCGDRRVRPARSPARGPGPAQRRPSQLAPPPQPKKKSKRHRSATKWRPCRTRLRHRSRRGAHRAERRGDNASQEPAGRPGTQQKRPASHTLRFPRAPLCEEAFTNLEVLRTWAVGLGAGRAGRLLCAARQMIGESVGQIRPPRATDGSDCCATPGLHREMEAAPRVSTAPRGDWRRRRPRPSPGNPGASHPSASVARRVSPGSSEAFYSG
ncbi:uncharacterized protein LOC128789678 [Vidua chalybeata]|uniref:uncharacterized protein LOC128789678 n=1 Tax=Vidua chalybeata TaxID=81927 RepID=UPI0023A7E663|nr:uncharacterized protein LOC128789678 [Vidua chalybeata]